MSASQPESTLSVLLYELRSVTLIDAPSDSEGTWFRYVIAQGSNEITGLRAGSAAEVNLAVSEMVDNLNLRSRGKNVKKAKTVSVSAAASAPQQSVRDLPDPS